MWLADTKVCPKDGPSEGCDWSRKSVRRMIRPKDVIGRYEDLVLEIVWRMLHRLLIGRDEYVVLEIVRKDAPKDFDWLRRSNLSVWRCVRLVVLPDGSDWTRREPCLFFLDATDWTVRWTFLGRMLLIGWSDWSAFSVFFWLLCCAISDSRTWMTRKWLRENVFSRRRIHRSDLFLTPKQTKQTSPCFTYSTRRGVDILCTMPMMWLGKCVCV